MSTRDWHIQAYGGGKDLRGCCIHSAKDLGLELHRQARCFHNAVCRTVERHDRETEFMLQRIEWTLAKSLREIRSVDIQQA